MPTPVREKFRDSAVYSGSGATYAGAMWFGAEMFKTLGYYVTESSQHVASMFPFSVKNRNTSNIPALRWTHIKKLQMWQRRITRRQATGRPVKSNYRFPIDHSWEFGSIIIHSLETGQPSRFTAM